MSFQNGKYRMSCKWFEKLHGYVAVCISEGKKRVLFSKDQITWTIIKETATSGNHR